MGVMGVTLPATVDMYLFTCLDSSQKLEVLGKSLITVGSAPKMVLTGDVDNIYCLSGSDTYLMFGIYDYECSVGETLYLVYAHGILRG